MKYPLKITFILALTLFCFAVESANGTPIQEVNKTGVYLNEIGVGSGYAWGTLNSDPDNLALYPVFVRIGFNINSLLGIEGRQSTLQLTLEPFFNSISDPKAGFETGCSVGFRYLHKLSGPVDLFTEASVAPMYLSIKSAEQGDAGFNFLDQLGAGLQCKVSRRAAIFAGYRFRHISNAGLADRPNTGINSNALVAGFSWIY